MAGEIIKTEGIVLAINPWSRTSHVVTWLTRDHGIVSTLVKGAVRPKSSFLGQYDFFYKCDVLFYARASSGGLHALREVYPQDIREGIRNCYRAIPVAGYAVDLVRSLAPPSGSSIDWFEFLDKFLSTIKGDYSDIISLEMKVLDLCGLSPDFSALDPDAPWTSFSIESGRCAEGVKCVRITPAVVKALRRPDSPFNSEETIRDAIRFLGMFLSYHIDRLPEPRRIAIQMLHR